MFSPSMRAALVSLMDMVDSNKSEVGRTEEVLRDRWPRSGVVNLSSVPCHRYRVVSVVCHLLDGNSLEMSD